MANQNKRVFVCQPFSSEFDAAFQLIRAAAQAVGAETWRLDQFAVAGSITEQLYDAIETSDLIVFDITHADPNVSYPSFVILGR